MRALFREAPSGTKSSTQLQQYLNAMLQDPTETDEVQPNVVGASMVRRYLHDSDLFEYVKRKKVPRSTDAHVAARLAWTSAYVDYGERWQSTIFPNENKSTSTARTAVSITGTTSGTSATSFSVGRWAVAQ